MTYVLRVSVQPAEQENSKLRLAQYLQTIPPPYSWGVISIPKTQSGAVKEQTQMDINCTSARPT